MVVRSVAIHDTEYARGSSGRFAMSRRSRDHTNGGGKGTNASFPTYTGRSSWPTLEWALQTKLDAQGLPGYIITSGDITVGGCEVTQL